MMGNEFTTVPATTPVVVNSSTPSGGYGDGFGMGGGGWLMGTLLGATLFGGRRGFDCDHDRGLGSVIVDGRGRDRDDCCVMTALNQLGISQAEQTNSINGSIGGATANINNHLVTGFSAVTNAVHNGTIANLQGFHNMNQHICEEGRHQDTGRSAQTIALAAQIGNVSDKVGVVGAALSRDICDLGKDVMTGNYALNTSILESRFENALQGKDIQLQAELNTCKILKAIDCDGDKTRGLITENLIADKNFKINALQDALTECRFNSCFENVKAQQANTNVILGSIVTGLSNANTKVSV